MRSKGFTLIEVLVASTIALVVLAAATGVFVTSQAQRLRAERELAVSSAVATAFLVIQRDVQNAGAKFTSSLFAARVLDAPASVKNDSSSAIDSASGCPDASGGLMPGSDVLEIMIGHPERSYGNVTFTKLLGGNTAQYTTANLAPFGTNDIGGQPRVVVFVSQTTGNRSCLALSDPPTVPRANTLNATLLDRDLLPITSASTVYRACPWQVPLDTPPPPAPQPAPQTVVVWALDQRIRYMVCRPNAGGTTGLYRQVSTRPDGRFTGIAPTLVQEDIEDLQVSPRIGNDDGAFSAKPDCLCTAAPLGTGPGNYCYCAAVPAVAATTADPAAGSSIDENAAISRINGLRIGLSAVRPDLITMTATRDPTVKAALLNNAAANDPVDQRKIRSQQIETVSLPNLTIVTL